MKVSPRVRANRANAQRSTGPRTSEGKSRVAKNALRHGLAIPVTRDPSLEAGVERLAQIIAGQGAADPPHLELARRIAEAQTDLFRVRYARLALLSDPQARVKKMSTRLKRSIFARLKRAANAIGTIEAVEDAFEAMENLADDIVPDHMTPTLEEGLGALAIRLMRLDRYERRALSRRKTAIREFDASVGEGKAARI